MEAIELNTSLPVRIMGEWGLIDGDPWNESHVERDNKGNVVRPDIGHNFRCDDGCGLNAFVFIRQRQSKRTGEPAQFDVIIDPNAGPKDRTNKKVIRLHPSAIHQQ